MALMLAPQLASELEEIWLYVARKSGNPKIADALIDSITSRFSILSSYPHLGRPLDKDLLPGLRSFPIGNYVVFCKGRGNDVLSLHAAHGRCDLESLFEF